MWIQQINNIKLKSKLKGFTNKKINGKKFSSLKTKIIVCVLFALILAIFSSIVAYHIGAFVVDDFFLSEEAELERDVELYQSFVSFVEEENVASTDSEKLDEWISQYDDRVYLTVYREDKVFLKDFEISGDEVIPPDKVPEDSGNNGNDDYSFIDNAMGEGNL